MISCVFLCGDRSPYGMAHLEAIGRCFDLKAVVIADGERWRSFRDRLTGGEASIGAENTSPKARLKALLKQPLVRCREHAHRRRLGSLGVPVLQVHDANLPDTLNGIRRHEPELLLSAAYPQILGKDLLGIAPRGAVNFHPSLLPRCRGAHPHYWCLAAGEPTGGVTAHFMTERIDEGDIIAQRPIDLTGLYYDDLYRRIVAETLPLVQEVARFFNDPDAKATPQDESRATRYRNDREQDRRLDFMELAARQLLNRIRAGRAFTQHRGRRITVHRADVVDLPEANDLRPGVIVDVSREGIRVAARDARCLLIRSVVAGRRTRSA